MNSGDHIKLLVFGWVREAIGSPYIIIENMQGRTVRELRGHLHSIYSLEEKLKGSMIAVNHKYASDDVVLRTSDEIALIPPVSGG